MAPNSGDVSRPPASRAAPSPNARAILCGEDDMLSGGPGGRECEERWSESDRTAYGGVTEGGTARDCPAIQGPAGGHQLSKGIVIVNDWLGGMTNAPIFCRITTNGSGAITMAVRR